MENTFLTHLKSNLPEPSWQWVIAALRHDDLIWEALQANSVNFPTEVGIERDPERWNPAFIAFMTLHQPVPPFDAPLSLGLRQRAFRTYETITQHHQNTTGELQPMMQAILLAIALRERLRLSDKWDTLVDELSSAPLEIWYTPLACLFGLIEKPLDILRTLLTAGVNPTIHSLAIHTLLSNPLPPETQTAHLKNLLENLTITEKSTILKQLSTIRPKLAEVIAQQVNLYSQSQKLKYPLDDLINTHHRVEIALLGKDRAYALSALNNAQDSARFVQANLAAQSAQVSEDPLTSWKKAFELAPDEPIYRSRLALAYLDQHNITEANAILDPLENKEHPDLLFASAHLAYQTNNQDQAREYALQALMVIETSPNTYVHHNKSNPTFSYQLAQLLMTLNLPPAAVRAARIASRERTDDPEPLVLMGQAQTAAGNLKQAVDSFRWAVLLAPQKPGLHRNLAKSLEAAGDWVNALEERKIMAAEPTSQIEDQYDLADCALHNAQPTYAVEICRAVLDKNPDDGMAYALLGEAFASLGDLTAAQEHFTHASEIEPSLPRPWIAMARVYKQNNQPQRAIDTLRTASQANQNSAAIFQALGEEYLDEGALTQALTSFQRAAEIEPDNNHTGLKYGKILYQLGHVPQAHEVIKRVYQNDPTNIEVANTYARISLHKEEPKAAVPALETVLASNPIEPEPYIDYARALLLTQGDAVKATQALHHAIDIAPENYEAQALLGEALSAEHKYTEAMEAFQTALETPLAQHAEWQSRLSYGLGNVALHLDKIEIAITSLLEAAQTDPQNYRPHCLLSEAYQTIGLIPDSYQSAREALHLAGDDCEVMLWYVDKSLQLAEREQKYIKNTDQQNSENNEKRLHAMQVLSTTAEIAPPQAEILLRIAEIQNSTGDKTGATECYRRVATIESATASDLRKAALALLNLSDASGAVECLEKGLAISQRSHGNDDIQKVLLIQLASTYQQLSNPRAALQAIENAILLYPNDVMLSQYKAQLLIELSGKQSAIAFLEETLTRVPDPRIYSTISNILQSEGKLLEALEYAEIGAQSQISEKNIDDSGFLQCVLLAADLALALLQPEHARRILNKHSLNIDTPNSPIESNYFGICSEVALHFGEEIEAANLLNKAIDGLKNVTPRLLALQARFTARRDDYSSAIDLYLTAIQDLKENEIGNPFFSKTVEVDGYGQLAAINSTPYTRQSTIYPIIEAALELNQWTSALQLAQEVVQIASAEPLSHLIFSRVLVQRAEFQHLCNDADIVKHAPGPVSLSEGTPHAFDQAIQTCQNICQSINLHLGLPLLPSSFERWLIRGNAVFNSSVLTAKSLTSLATRSFNPEDIAAAIAADRRLTGSNYQHIFNNTQMTGEILTQISLSIADENPLEALKTLQIANANDPIRNQFTAIRHYLLARIARNIDPQVALPAIQNALSLLPDEPRWNALAAEITFGSGDDVSAISHLERAIELEPLYFNHHLSLGQLYLKLSEKNEAASTSQAIKYLEQSSQLEPDEPGAWLSLARAYRLAGDLNQAAAAAEHAVILSPKNPDPLVLQAEIAVQAGKFQKALNFAETAIRLKPDSHKAAIILSQILQALERPAEALAVIDKAIPISDQTIPLTVERIHLIGQSQGPEIALQVASQLAQANPDEPAVLAILAETQANAGQDEIAIRTAQKALLLEESLSVHQQANLRLILGKLLRRVGQLDQAIHYLNEANRLAPDKIDAILELGRTHQDRRQQAQALQMYRHAANIAPLDPRPYVHAGLALKEGKDYIESESMLRHAAELAPNDTTIRRQLAGVIAINLVHNPRRSMQTETL